MPFGPKTPILDPPGGQKAVKMNFREKSENVMFLHSLRLSYMQKIRKFYCTVFRERGGRKTERQRERDGPEFKGPPDAIAKPSDQKEIQTSAFLKIIIFRGLWEFVGRGIL